jgi:hypothetical protein
MKSDFELIPSIANAAIGAVGDEMTFSFPEVLEVIRLCSANHIAVLGVEVFEVRAEGYHTKNLSGYDQEMNDGPRVIEGWPDYVTQNNSLAGNFIHQNQMGDDHVYVLTTASWREFCKIQEVKRQ